MYQKTLKFKKTNKKLIIDDSDYEYYNKLNNKNMQEIILE